jgi:hypothetical protein
MAPWQPVAAPTAAPALGVDPALQAPCATHPGNAAEGICERCGDFMCRLCATPVEGRLYCPRCFDLLYNRGALHFTHRQFTLPGTAFGLGLAAFFTSLVGFLFCSLFFSIPLGVFGVLAGMRGLKEHHLRPELPNRGYTTWGLALSAASLLISLGMAGFLVWTFVRAASS